MAADVLRLNICFSIKLCASHSAFVLKVRHIV
jgi:hypothetical protein